MPRKKTDSSSDAGDAKAAGAAAFVRHVRLTGGERGLVKNLSGFRKKHHSVPEFASAAAVAFLGKLCAGELAGDVEAFFQKAREAFAYKRKDIALDVASPSAVLTAKHFTLEWTYALDETAPDEWALTRTLHTLDFSDESADVFDGLFAGMFDRMVFSLVKGARVEDVIDAVESMGTAEDWTDPAPLSVTYPSSCATCTLRVADVPAEVVFNGGELSMVFPRAGSPRELIEAFAAVRHAFALARHPALEGLL